MIMMTLMNRLPDNFQLPGFVDMHVHLREPGNNHAETIASGTLSAALAGYVLLGDMPNNPGAETWTEAALIDKQDRQQRTGYIPYAAHSGSQPASDNIGELAAMARRSLLLKFYAGKTTGNKQDHEAAEFMEATTVWHRADPNRPIGLHAGKENLSDFIGMIASNFRHPLHIHHISDPEDVKIVMHAKKMGLPVTCGVTPHHLLKNSQATMTDGWFARMMPPLSHQTDSEQLMRQLADGEIDVIESDHAPHFPDGKFKAETENPAGTEHDGDTTCFGVPGIELIPQLLLYQVERGNISIERLVEAMSTRPAQILGVTISPDTRSSWKRDVYRIDNETNYAVSGSGWTPYLGMLAAGRLEALVIRRAPIIAAKRIIQRRGDYISQRGTVI